MSTNSSPPKRPKKSCARIWLDSSRARYFSTRSPAWWPKSVVDGLEAIDVQHHQRQVLATAFPARVLHVHALVVGEAIGQPGERVVQRLVLGFDELLAQPVGLAIELFELLGQHAMLFVDAFGNARPRTS